MPAERIQKSRTHKELPDLGNPDRKRVLNVLAQRRYRQRRKEKVALLEAQARSFEIPDDHQPISRAGESPGASSAQQGSNTNAELTNASCEDGLPTYAFHETSFDTSLMQTLGSKTWNLSSSSSNKSRLTDFPSLPTPLPSTPDFIEVQQEPPLSGFEFPLTADGGVLTVPILSAVRAFISIATALNITENLWDPSYLHVMPVSDSYQTSLPSNLRPVNVQLVVPHHPSLDLLPWPSMREKLICMLAMPNKLRPPIAQEEDQGPTNPFGMGMFPKDPCDSSSVAFVGQSRAIVQLIQDLEDPQDGIRVHGNTTAWGHSNELIEEAWEVGELFYIVHDEKWLKNGAVARSSRDPI
ncbi:hypothetical protein EKO04_001342 [Ascochyta lentis]|uniref:BZIP domain-containing protein n=1 Tax=Ascochyta lentis TaxID=205686 RepID=A0A8H7MM02_9PLEO|nr:hypothetical protein EKO04_001342 [Ascochyta lentis]